VPTSIQHSTGSLTQSIKAGKRNKSHPNPKGRSKLSADYVILNIKPYKKSTKNLLK